MTLVLHLYTAACLQEGHQLICSTTTTNKTIKLGNFAPAPAAVNIYSIIIIKPTICTNFSNLFLE